MNSIQPNPDNLEALPEHCPDLTYEEIKSFDSVLDNYLALCMEIYWQKVSDGTWPWPDAEDALDSTQID